MPSQPSILIAVLRNDLRVVDHPIFHLAHSGSLGSRITHVLPVYVFDERQIELGKIEGFESASKKEARTRVGKFWKCNVHRTRFLHESLLDLQKTLEDLGSTLDIYFGRPERVVPKLVKGFSDQGVRVEGVWIARENASEEIQVEQRLDAALRKIDSALHVVENRRSMIQPEDLPFDPSSKQMPDMYTAFRQKVEGLGDRMVQDPWPTPSRFKPPPDSRVNIESEPGCLQLASSENRELKDILPELMAPLEAEASESAPLEKSNVPYRGGLTEAANRLAHYTDGKAAPIATYKETRNGLLGKDFSTKFSPWLANGSLSPKVIFQRINEWEDQFGASKNSYWVKFELLWRDFFTFLMEKHGNAFFYLSGLALPQQEAPTDSHQHQKLPQKPHVNGKRETHDGYWLVNDWDKGAESDVQKWCYGRTGVPFIDANMRELKETGYMSNRGRQNVASFFTKDMGHQDWRLGAEWFESYLLDYDITSNFGNWQYIAGVGVDPRSARQFNIIKQGKDYDEKGAYVAHWLPGLAEVLERNNVDPGSIHHPWTIQQIANDLRADESLAVYASPHYEQRSWKSHYSRSGSDAQANRSRQHGQKKGNPGPGGGRQKQAQQQHNQQQKHGPGHQNGGRGGTPQQGAPRQVVVGHTAAA